MNIAYTSSLTSYRTTLDLGFVIDHFISSYYSDRHASACSSARFQEMVVAEALLVQLEQSLTKAKENEVIKYLDQISEVGRQSDNRYQDKTTSLI